jgi:hypothetical protein
MMQRAQCGSSPLAGEVRWEGVQLDTISHIEDLPLRSAPHPNPPREGGGIRSAHPATEAF